MPILIMNDCLLASLVIVNYMLNPNYFNPILLYYIYTFV
jgi:hypothetical protein